MRLVILLVLGLLTTPSFAQDIASAIRADHWDEAMADAAATPDGLAQKLVTYYRLLAPNMGSVSEIGAFMAANPDWPQVDLLDRRRNEALAREPDDRVAAAVCVNKPPSSSPGWLRCALAATQLGQTDNATTYARRAWVGSLATPAAETAFLQRWSSALRPEDELSRFDALAWTDTVSAARQLIRLDAADKPLAEARLALRRDEPTALILLGRLTPTQLAEPSLFLEQARYLRRAGRNDEALALWHNAGAAVEASAPPARLPAFWAERNLLARRRLQLGDSAGAYELVATDAQHAPEQVAEAEFFAGFIALRFRNDPNAATRHFQAMQPVATALITRARMHYWLARAAGARGDVATQHEEFAAASRWPTTYYGQLAALADGEAPARLNARIAALTDPPWSEAQALDFAGLELTRAATLLVAWGEKRRAHAFLLRLQDVMPSRPVMPPTPALPTGGREKEEVRGALVGRLATLFGMPDMAVMIARRAGRDAVALPQTGWPVPVTVPDGPVPAAVTLGLIRQESSFDPGAVSPVGARGLMQLMPATAASIGKKLGQVPTLQALTADPGLNITLGTTFLRSLLEQFGNSVPLAVAAYNAGPNRVVEWLAGNGDPRVGPIDVVDWIELIPFDETRNYVQRVSENILIYQARRDQQAALAMAEEPRP
jgi:soluble lytic murein transglycosylase